MAQSLVSVAHLLAEETGIETYHFHAANVIRAVPSRHRGVPEGEPETLGSRGRCHRPGGVWDGVWRSGDLPNRERDRLS